MADSIVHIWANDGSGNDNPKSREHAEQILARLRVTPPLREYRLPAFASDIEREVLCYYPDHPSLVAAFGNLQQQVAGAQCAVFSLVLPADDVALAVRLLLKHAWSVFCYFEPSGMLYIYRPVDGFPVSPVAQQWLADCAAFPRSLDEVRQRAATLMAEPLQAHGFSYEKAEKGDFRLVRHTVGGVQQSINVYFSKRYGQAQIDVLALLTSDALEAVSRASGISFFCSQLITLSKLVYSPPRPDRAAAEGPTKLYSWDDVVDIARLIERTVMPMLDRHDSVATFDAFLDGSLFPELTPRRWAHPDQRLAAAYLANNPNYEEIKRETLLKLEGQITPQAENARRLAVFLETFPPGTIPETKSHPDAPSMDIKEAAADMASRIRKRLRDLGFKKKTSRLYAATLVRDVEELCQSLNLALTRKDGRWGFRIGIEMDAKPDLPISKAVIKALRRLRGFYWNLNGMLRDDFFWFDTWTEFEALFDDCERQLRDLLQGIDSLAAIKAAFYLESSPRYCEAMFRWNRYEAYTVAALLGGPDADAIMARARAAVDAIEDEQARASEKAYTLPDRERAVKRALKALQAQAVT